MELDLVSEALKFMVIGMGTVFVFLIVMVIFMNLLSKIVHTLFPETPPTFDIPSENNNNKVAAIVAAIKHHNEEQGK